MMVFADSCTFKGLPFEARRIIDCLQSGFVLELVQFLCFLSQPMRLHAMALHQGIGTCLITLCGVMEKKFRFFLLNSNFTCFLSSRFHHCIFALQDGEVPESLLINVAYFCDNGGLSAIREAFQEADPASLPFSIAHHLINIVTQVIMSNLHTIRHELFMSSIIIYCRKLFTGLTRWPVFSVQHCRSAKWKAVSSNPGQTSFSGRRGFYSSALSIQLNLSTTATMGTEENGLCREVAGVERLKQE